MDDVIARATLDAVVCAAYDRWAGGTGVDTEWQRGAGGGGERVCRLTACGADALLADGFPVLLREWLVTERSAYGRIDVVGGYVESYC